jgi:bla regulator protein blaR1
MNSIEPAFAWILSATLRASVLALVILGVQFLLRNRLSAAWRHALWLPMLTVLVLPVLPEASFGLFPPSAAKPSTVVESLGGADAILEVTEMTPQGILLRLEPAAAAAVPIVPVKLNGFAVLWFAGAIGMLVAGLIGYRRNLRRIRKAATAPDPMLQAAIDEAALRAGLKHAPQALISPAVTSPAVTGFVRPLLLLPTGFPDGFSATEARLILLHEFIHLKRLDLPLNWLICLLQSLHWFNPLLWFAFARLRADREAACDARVLSMDAADHRAAYGGALLKLQRTASIRTPSLGFVGIFERGSEIQSRIRGICAHRPKHRAWQATGAGILALLMLFGVTKGQQPRPVPAEVDPALPVDEAAREIILKKLNSIIIPRLDFQDTTVEEAIDFLRLRSAELDTAETDPSKKGVNLLIVPPRPGPEGAAAKRLTIAELKLRNVPLGRAIQYICELTHLQYKVDDTAVILGAKEAANAQPAEAKDSPAKEAIQKKLDSIIIPSIDFQDTSLGEAIHFLRLRSIELDPEETGLNFVLRLPRPASGEPAAMPRIKELKLNNVPLAAALQQICELTNHEYSVDENAVTLSPKN